MAHVARVIESCGIQHTLKVELDVEDSIIIQLAMDSIVIKHNAKFRALSNSEREGWKNKVYERKLSQLLMRQARQLSQEDMIKMMSPEQKKELIERLSKEMGM